MVTAKSLGLEYVYKPLTYIEHCPAAQGKIPTERELKRWVDRFENQLNFNKISTVPHINTLNRTIKTVDHRDILGILRSGNLRGAHILATRETHLFNEHFRNDESVISAWKTVVTNLNQVYGWDRTYLPHFDMTPHTNNEVDLKDKWIHVAVHIRRGDAEGNERRSLDLGYYLNVMKSILETIKQINAKNNKQFHIGFHIYSQGNNYDFNELNVIEEDNVSTIVYHLDVDVCETLHHLACSHVLIMAKSTLSYLCALLNPKGTVIYYPFWLQPPKYLEEDWLQYSKFEANFETNFETNFGKKLETLHNIK